MEMGLIHAGLLIVLCFVNASQSRSSSRYGPVGSDPEQEWNELAKALEDESALTYEPRSRSSSGSSVAQKSRVSPYLTVSAHMVQKEFFKPERGFRSLPSSVVEILRPTPNPASLPANSEQRLEVLCLLDRMYVRIKKELFNNRYAYRLLKLGTCPVNKDDEDYYYFLHLLKTDCGFKIENTADTMDIEITLHYTPPQSNKPWILLREMPFHIPLRCKYHRWFHSYTVGFHPELMGGTVFKQLTQKTNFLLVAQDGNKLTGFKVYTLGQTMYFEAKRAGGTAVSGDERIYINRCSVTTSQDPNSSPKAVVIDQQGCMFDGKLTRQSRFLTCPSEKIQRFSLGTFVFKDKLSGSTSQQFFIHCDISMGELKPTQTSKACNYDLSTKKWKELYGDDAVCACCENSSCSAQLRASKNTDTSVLTWKVDLKDGKVRSLDAEESSGEDTVREDSDFQDYWEYKY